MGIFKERHYFEVRRIKIKANLEDKCCETEEMVCRDFEEKMLSIVANYSFYWWFKIDKKACKRSTRY